MGDKEKQHSLTGGTAAGWITADYTRKSKASKVQAEPMMIVLS